MEIKKIEMGKLRPAKYNPRVELKPGDAEYEKLKRSIVEFGFVEPVIWNKRTGNVVGGHQRLSVLRDLGETMVDCVVVDLDELKEKALNVALNKVQGRWDEEKLAELLTDLDANVFDVSMTGFDAAEVDELMNRFYSREAVQDEFDYAEAEEEVKVKGGPVSKSGEVWLLGNHRLICGNPSDSEIYNKLLKGESAQACVTEPQFLSQAEYKEHGINTWLEKIKAVVANVARHSGVVVWSLGDMYATGTQFIEPTSVFSVQTFADAGLRPLWIRVWKKQNSKSSASSYKLNTNKPIQQYEYISAFSRNGEDEYNDQEYEWVSAFAGHSYKFVKRLTKDERKKWGYAGVWEMSPIKTFSESQSTQPIELPWRCIKMHSDKGAVVLDPFANVGTTLIACEQTDRRCFAIEENPELVDIIVKRWESFTGQKAVKV